MKKNTIVLGLVICIAVVSVVFAGTFKTYNSDEKNNETKKINNDLALILIDENGKETETEEIPDPSEYYLDKTKSYCKNGSELNWNIETGKVEITTTKADNCVIYFKKLFYLGDEILANYGGAESITEKTSFSSVNSDNESNLYKATDDYGTSYYFYGDVTNNYVEFGKYPDDSTEVRGYYKTTASSFKTYTSLDECNAATSYNIDCTEMAGKPMYWRIVRINGDGTIKLIHNGTELVENGLLKRAGIGGSSWSVKKTTPSYLDSNLKTVIDSWYVNNLKNDYGTYIADRIFCNDREVTGTDADGYDVYGAYTRLVTNKSPKLTCTQDEDKFTVAGGQLTNPVALITIDELAMAGNVVSTTNKNNYLNNSSYYWTMSPYSMTSTYPQVWQMGTSYIYGSTVNSANTNYSFIVPAINLNSNLLFSGSGTITDPYVFVKADN